MLTDAVYVLLKSDSLQKATGAAFFILFTASFIFFFLTKIIDRDDNSFDPKIKNTLNLIYMSMVSIVIHYIHNSTAGTIFSFLLTFFLSATLILLILSCCIESPASIVEDGISLAAKKPIIPPAIKPMIKRM